LPPKLITLLHKLDSTFHVVTICCTFIYRAYFLEFPSSDNSGSLILADTDVETENWLSLR